MSNPDGFGRVDWGEIVVPLGAGSGRDAGGEHTQTDASSQHIVESVDPDAANAWKQTEAPEQAAAQVAVTEPEPQALVPLTSGVAVEVLSSTRAATSPAVRQSVRGGIKSLFRRKPLELDAAAVQAAGDAASRTPAFLYRTEVVGQATDRATHLLPDMVRSSAAGVLLLDAVRETAQTKYSDQEVSEAIRRIVAKTDPLAHPERVRAQIRACYEEVGRQAVTGAVDHVIDSSLTPRQATHAAFDVLGVPVMSFEDQGPYYVDGATLATMLDARERAILARQDVPYKVTRSAVDDQELAEGTLAETTVLLQGPDGRHFVAGFLPDMMSVPRPDGAKATVFVRVGAVAIKQSMVPFVQRELTRASVSEETISVDGATVVQAGNVVRVGLGQSLDFLTQAPVVGVRGDNRMFTPNARPKLPPAQSPEVVAPESEQPVQAPHSPTSQVATETSSPTAVSPQEVPPTGAPKAPTESVVLFDRAGKTAEQATVVPEVVRPASDAPEVVTVRPPAGLLRGPSGGLRRSLDTDHATPDLVGVEVSQPLPPPMTPTRSSAAPAEVARRAPTEDQVILPPPPPPPPAPVETQSQVQRGAANGSEYGMKDWADALGVTAPEPVRIPTPPPPPPSPQASVSDQAPEFIVLPPQVLPPRSTEGDNGAVSIDNAEELGD